MVLQRLKKPKVEEVEQDEEEKALMVLIEHQQKKIESLETMLEDAKKRLRGSQSDVDHLRSHSSSTVRSKMPLQVNGVRSKLQLLTPTSSSAAAPNYIGTPAAATTTLAKVPSSFPPGFPEKPVYQVRDTTSIPIIPSHNRASKRKHVLTQTTATGHHHQDLITGVRSRASPNLINFGNAVYIPSMHHRKLRSLALDPIDGRELLVTSSLDGTVNLWKLQTHGSATSLLSTRDCASPKARRWPQDIAWHPDGDRIFAAYNADDGDSQISIVNINLLQVSVNFLEEKPHVKGIINTIVFTPWEDKCFATGGSDHSVIIWTERESAWIPQPIHRAEHSSAVMGVAGLKQNKTIVSAGLDKRLIGFDLLAENTQFKHQVDSKCLTVLPNPSDCNLLMLQTGALCRQLRLIDIRSSEKEIAVFGYKQVSSESNSALIKPAWSPDGLCISSGSPDPKIHIFDIRYNACNPAQSLHAHKKRILKAEWHRSYPLLISISSDLLIGIHHIT